MSFDLESLYKSLIRQIQLCIDAVQDAGYSSDIQYYSWDARGEEQELPTTDLIGLAGWSFKENGGLWNVRAGLTLSTVNDENLFREVQILDIIHAYWGEGVSIPMLDKTTGQEVTVMHVADFDVMPAGNAEKRNYRPIGIELLKSES